MQSAPAVILPVASRVNFTREGAYGALESSRSKPRPFQSPASSATGRVCAGTSSGGSIGGALTPGFGTTIMLMPDFATIMSNTIGAVPPVK
ncbi:hypothetical protein D3C81_2136960 [compost metagenome]